MTKKDNNNDHSFNSFNSFINNIVLGNNLELFKTIPNNSIDFIFADPPYNMQIKKTNGLSRFGSSMYYGVAFEQWDQFESLNEYDEFTLKWLKECFRVLKPTGILAVIGSFQNIFRLGYFIQNLNGWILNDIIWNKPNAMPNFSGVRFANAHETIIVCVKDKKSKHTFNYKTMKYLNNNKQQRSVWDINTCIGSERLKNSDGSKLHSTQKPEELLKNLILAYTKKDDLVLDPFAGTSTTLAVAKKYHRRYIGFEQDEKYVQASKIRLNEVVYETNKLLIDNTLDKKSDHKITYADLVQKGLIKKDDVIKIDTKQTKDEKLYDLTFTLNEDGLLFYEGAFYTPNNLATKLLKRKVSAWHIFITNNKTFDDYRKELIKQEEKE